LIDETDRTMVYIFGVLIVPIVGFYDCSDGVVFFFIFHYLLRERNFADFLNVHRIVPCQ
jgi:hypothetical protein